MSKRNRMLRLTFLLAVLSSSMLLMAQPKAISKKDSLEEAREQRKLARIAEEEQALALGIKNVVSIHATRLLSLRFPSITFNYQRLLGEKFAVMTSLGIPVNRVNQFRNTSGSLSGIDTRLGIRFYPTLDPEFRFYIGLDGMHHNNPVKAEGFLQEEGKTTYRATELNLKRKRELGLLSLGFQLFTYSGFNLDMYAGFVLGRRGIFVKGGQPFLAENTEDAFLNEAPLPNEWSNYNDLQLGLSLGYSF